MSIGLLIALALILFAILATDWRKLARKASRFAMVGGVFGCLMLLWMSAAFTFIPGLNSLGANVIQATHLKPLVIQIISTQSDTLDYTEGEYLIIEARITNSSKEPISLAGGLFFLTDIQGRRFALEAINPDPSIIGRDLLNPGLSATCSLVFHVPNTQGFWWLNLQHKQTREIISAPLFVQ